MDKKNNSSLKVLIVSDMFYPHTGGVSEHMLYLCKNLRSLGHDARVLAPSFGDNGPYMHEHFLRIGKAISIPKNGSFSVITFGLLIPWQMRALLEREKFDIIHVHGPIAPVLPYFAIKYSNARNFATFHSAHEDSLGYLLWEPVLEQYFRKLDGLIAVSEVARDSVSKYFPGEYHIIPNGIDTDRFKPDNEPVADLQQYSPIILFVGRFEPRKGLKFLLKAFPEVVKEYPSAKLVIVGEGFLEGYYRRYIQRHIEESVIFIGFVPPEDLPRYYASCDVFCSPATGAESFGIVLLEAMASQKPIVASDIPGYRKVMEHDKQGLLFRPCDAGDLADKLIDMLQDSGRRKSMGMQGRKTALSYNWRNITERIVSLYYNALNINN